MLELNEVLLTGEARTLSLIARDGELTCITGGTAERRTRMLCAMMGLEPVVSGYVSIDGEPMNRQTGRTLRRLMAYAPARLVTEGETVRYEAPTVQELFLLKANRELPISNGILTAEMRRTGCAGDEGRWLAVAVLRNKPILVADSPPAASAAYLQALAANAGKTVIVGTTERAILNVANRIVEI